MKTKVYIDGSEGTTGLRINERFENRDDVEILHIDSDKRKDPEERAKFINASDITFLCLPDAAAIEAVGLIDKDNDKTVIIDTLNGIMIDDEFKRMNEKNYDKWQDLAASIYGLVTNINDLREDLEKIE